MRKRLEYCTNFSFLLSNNLRIRLGFYAEHFIFSVFPVFSEISLFQVFGNDVKKALIEVMTLEWTGLSRSDLEKLPFHLLIEQICSKTPRNGYLIVFALD